METVWSFVFWCVVCYGWIIIAKWCQKTVAEKPEIKEAGIAYLLKFLKR